MAGTLVIDNLTDGSGNTTSATNAIRGSARAWINFDGTSATPGAGRANYNVSSVTKNATGDYTVNFTNALADANYASVVSVSSTTGVADAVTVMADSNRTGSAIQAPTTTTFRFSVVNAGAGTTRDVPYCHVAIFR